MKRDIKRTLHRGVAAALLMAVGLWALPLPVQAAEAATATTLRLEAAEGEHVTLQDKSEKDLSILPGMKLFSGYTVQTGEVSYAWMSLDDAKVVKMASNSKVELAQNGRQLEAMLKSGELFFNVERPLADDETFHIRTSTMVTGIRGTSAFVRVVDKWRTDLFCITGKLHVYASDPVTSKETTYLLQAGQRASVFVQGGGYELEEEVEIRVEGYTDDDVPGWVGVETGLAGAEEKLAEEQAQERERMEELREAMDAEANETSYEPLFVRDNPPRPVTQPAPPADDASSSSSPVQPGGPVAGQMVMETDFGYDPVLSAYVNNGELAQRLAATPNVTVKSSTGTGTLYLPNALTVPGGGQLTMQNGSVEVTGSVTGNGTLSFGASMTLHPGGSIINNSPNSVRLLAGSSLRVAPGAAFTNTANGRVVVAGNASLYLEEPFINNGVLESAGLVDAGTTITNNGTMSILPTGRLHLADGNDLAMNNPITNQGAIVVGANTTLTLPAGAALGGGGAVNLGNNAVLNIPAGASVTLSGASDMANGQLVCNGTLRVQGSGTLAPANMVNGGSITVASGGLRVPGVTGTGTWATEAGGTLCFANALAINSAVNNRGTLRFEAGATLNVPVANNNVLEVAGGATVAAPQGVQGGHVVVDGNLELAAATHTPAAVTVNPYRELKITDGGTLWLTAPSTIHGTVDLQTGDLVVATNVSGNGQYTCTALGDRYALVVQSGSISLGRFTDLNASVQVAAGATLKVDAGTTAAFGQMGSGAFNNIFGTLLVQSGTLEVRNILNHDNPGAQMNLSTGAKLSIDYNNLTKKEFTGGGALQPRDGNLTITPPATGELNLGAVDLENVSSLTFNGELNAPNMVLDVPRGKTVQFNGNASLKAIHNEGTVEMLTYSCTLSLSGNSTGSGEYSMSTSTLCLTGRATLTGLPKIVAALNTASDTVLDIGPGSFIGNGSIGGNTNGLVRIHPGAVTIGDNLYSSRITALAGAQVKSQNVSGELTIEKGAEWTWDSNNNGYGTLENLNNAGELIIKDTTIFMEGGTNTGVIRGVGSGGIEVLGQLTNAGDGAMTTIGVIIREGGVLSFGPGQSSLSSLMMPSKGELVVNGSLTLTGNSTGMSSVLRDFVEIISKNC